MSVRLEASGAVVIELPSIPGSPPSLNALGARGGGRAFHRKKRQWQGLIGTAILASELPVLLAGGRRASSIEARGEIAFRTNRRRDEGNFRAMLEKSLGDALVDDPKAWPGGRWLADDDVDRFRFGRLELVVDPELPGILKAETRLELELEVER